MWKENFILPPEGDIFHPTVGSMLMEAFSKSDKRKLFVIIIIITKKLFKVNHILQVQI